MKKPKVEFVDEWTERNRASFFRRLLNETGNPYYAWEAIQACTEERPFRRLPDWLMAYLSECAERMLSSKAKRTRDLGRVLPWVLGFPITRGPGRVLDPEPESNEPRLLFAIHFAGRVREGENPSLARQNACIDVFGDTGPDDRTLQRWLRKEFGLKTQPSTIEEWKKVAEARFWWALGLPPPWLTKSRETLS
jgi:hypothetical protein